MLLGPDGLALHLCTRMHMIVSWVESLAHQKGVEEVTLKGATE